MLVSLVGVVCETESCRRVFSMKRIFFLTFLVLVSQPACVVAGYSSRGGWFFWPGGLGLVVMIVLVLLLFRRRGRG